MSVQQTLTFTVGGSQMSLADFVGISSAASQAGAPPEAKVSVSTYSGDQRDPRDYGSTTVTIKWTP